MEMGKRKRKFIRLQMENSQVVAHVANLNKLLAIKKDDLKIDL